MSVGMARIRADPDAIRKGAIDKGEDPSLVDRALELDARVRGLRAERDDLRALRKRLSREYHQQQLGRDPR